MYKTVTRNLRKRKRIAQTWYLETTTMFQPNEDSVAEKTYGEAEAIREGRKKRGRARLMYDHRYGECADVRVEADLRAAIMEAFGEAIDWNDIDGIVDEFYDTRADEQSSRRFFLNAQTSSADAWLKFEEWDACKRPELGLRDRDFVTLGLDGSLRDDATALVATRISDGHQELIGCWEKGEDDGDDWEVDREAVDSAVAAAFRRFEVGAFFCDPPHYGDYIAKWTNEFGEKLQAWGSIKAKPLEYWTTRAGIMVEALAEYRQAVREQRVTYTPPDDRVNKEHDLAVTFTRHVLNARRHEKNRAGLLISKATQKSDKKIDACMAAVISWAARNACIAKGAKSQRKLQYAAKRIR
jgi:hypothetical protein